MDSMAAFVCPKIVSIRKNSMNGAARSNRQKVKSQSLCKIIEGHAASLYEIKSV